MDLIALAFECLEVVILAHNFVVDTLFITKQCEHACDLNAFWLALPAEVEFRIGQEGTKPQDTRCLPVLAKRKGLSAIAFACKALSEDLG